MSDLTIENSEVVVLSDIFHANSKKVINLNRPNDFSQTLAKWTLDVNKKFRRMKK